MKVYDEPRKSMQVEMGDVITHPDFAYGIRDKKKGYLKIRTFSKIMLEHDTYDIFRYDETRSNAWFVVEETFTEQETFIHQHGKDNSSPIRHTVYARRLNDKHDFDSDGEVIMFEQLLHEASYFVEEVTVVGKMQRVFK